jgi:predicted nucleotidyltransferase
MLSREDIFRSVESQREALRARGVRRLGLFGSFALNEAREDSVIDLLVELEPNRVEQYFDVKFMLEDLLGRDVDLVIAEDIKPTLRKHILPNVIDVPGL